jgi:hypothetical protein
MAVLFSKTFAYMYSATITGTSLAIGTAHAQAWFMLNDSALVVF